MSDDLIKRSDAIDAVIKTEIRASIYYKPNWDMVKKFIEAIPSADRPQGEWIVNMINYESLCSVCGAKETAFIYGTEMWYGLGKSKFCPSCGARMKGADDEDN